MTEPVLLSVEGEPDGFIFWCPGCECAHGIDKRWTVEGTPERPTVRGSVLVRGPAGGDGANLVVRCHLFVEDGKIRFLSDCTHHLSGQTVEMTPPP